MTNDYGWVGRGPRYPSRFSSFSAGLECCLGGWKLRRKKTRVCWRSCRGMTVEVLPQKSNLSISGVGPLWSLVETVGGLDSYLAFRQPTNQTVGPHHRELGNVKLGARFLWCIKHPIATVVFFVMAPSSSLNRVELCMVCSPSSYLTTLFSSEWTRCCQAVRVSCL